MPVITDEGEDGVVTAWMVDEGGRVAAGQLVAEVQAEKVAEEVHAPTAGVLRDRVGINEPVPQGSPICRIVDAGEDLDTEAGAEGNLETAPAAAPASRVAASPAAKRLARELGVDLAAVSGSGPEGRITEADVRVAGGDAAAPAGMVGLRAVIARNMRESLRTTAPVTLTTTVDVTDNLPDHITAWVVREAALALAEHPTLNGTRDGDRFVPGDQVDIALAIQTDDGLVAPVVRKPGSKSVESVADDIAQLAKRAQTRQLGASDFEGATFSATSLGALGIDAFTPIINPPQVAILGVGAVRTVAGFAEGTAVPRRHLTLSLTFDHSFVDGTPAAEFLASLRERLQSNDRVPGANAPRPQGPGFSVSGGGT